MNRRVLFLVCSDLQRGDADASKLGTKIAARRFALPNNDDLRVVKNFNELDVVAGRTFLVKGSDFHEMPAHLKDELSQTIWLENNEMFQQFVAAGHGVWVDVPMSVSRET